MTVPRLLFLCVENSCRSQMAEAFARIHGAGRCEPRSAGSKPSGVVDLKAVQAMRELDYDLGAHRSESVDDLPDVLFDVVVTMGCGDACPTVRAKQRLDWRIPDPKHMGAEEFREVRDRIGASVRALLEQLQ
jgi:protein-tyrosine-phosphatase